jgi:hypothetical protein
MRFHVFGKAVIYIINRKSFSRLSRLSRTLNSMRLVRTNSDEREHGVRGAAVAFYALSR